MRILYNKNKVTFKQYQFVMLRYKKRFDAPDLDITVWKLEE